MQVPRNQESAADVASRRAKEMRDENQRLQDALKYLQRLDSGQNHRFDFSISAQLHSER
jgi:hypothetical protein